MGNDKFIWNGASNRLETVDAKTGLVKPLATKMTRAPKLARFDADDFWTDPVTGLLEYVDPQTGKLRLATPGEVKLWEASNKKSESYLIDDEAEYEAWLADGCREFKSPRTTTKSVWEGFNFGKPREPRYGWTDKEWLKDLPEDWRGLVFVYGSLRKGFGNHGRLKTAEFIGYGKTVSNGWTMLDLGAFPGVVPGGKTHIFGEIYRCDRECWDGLDSLEGYPSLYNRECVEVKSGELLYNCNMYVYQEHKRNVVESGDWSESDPDPFRNVPF